jgi:oligopeptide transport system permease protein
MSAAGAPTPATGPWIDAWRRLAKNRPAVASAVVLLALATLSVAQPMLTSMPYDRADLALGPTPPSAAHWLGTDLYGRDLLSRLCFGGRVSLAVGIVATTLSFVLGTTWGGIAGYVGGRVDAVMMRIVDVLYTFPLIIFVILVLAFFAHTDTVFYEAFVAVYGLVEDHPRDPGHLPLFRLVFVFFALGAVSWLTMARIVRGQVIALRAMPFVEAARSIGVGHAGIVLGHLLPNALGPIIVYTALTIPEVMMVEAFLSFLGLGTEEPLSSWGLLAAGGAETLDLYPWLIAAPGLVLSLTLVCFNFLGDGLRDALDPRVRRGG